MFGSDAVQPVVIVKVNNTNPVTSSSISNANTNNEKIANNASPAPMLQDDFYTDSSLNTILWTKSSPILETWWSAHFTYSTSPINTNFTPNGIQMSGIQNKFDINGIQSLSSFSTPFSITAEVQNTPGPSYLFILTDGDPIHHHGFQLTGNSNGGCNFGYDDMKTEQNGIHTSADSGWCSFTLTVDRGGIGTLNFGDKTLPLFLNTGPFYVILGERAENTFSDPSINTVTWRYVQLSSS